MRYLITSATPYINGIKHLGNLAGSLLPADVYARFLRQEGHEVLFISATDEHGTPAELAAKKRGQQPEEYCLTMHNVQKKIYEKFSLSFDYLGRSSASANHKLTQDFYCKLDAAGLLEEQEIKQVYALEDERFLADRYIEGTCPRCGYEAARGDQCENCTALLDPIELINPRSALSGSTKLEIKTTKHLFFHIEKLSDRLRSWITAKTDWPTLTTSIALKWLDEGLHARCITRDLQWGVKVPRPGFEEKVFYVWFDAPVVYIAATKEWANLAPKIRDFKSWWFKTEDVVYTQFMAKDNVPFHTILWPAMIFGTNQPWLQATMIKSFNWLTYYGGKFSTSQKRGIFMDQALELLPADYWRYFLIAQLPEDRDTSFTWETFATIVNKDLVGMFGNFVNRVLCLIKAKFGDVIPAGGKEGDQERELFEACERCLIEYKEALYQLKYRVAISRLRKLWSLGNQYLDQAAPWTLLHQDRDAAAMVLRVAVNLVRLYALTALPLVPNAANAILLALKIKQESLRFEQGKLLSYLKAGHAFTVPNLLFRRITPQEIAEWEVKFGAFKS
ncbi:MAG: hypothetical protein RLZ12_866 [Bacillota bacterium]|jgi:methionyl-tRNA synthetase